MADDREKRLARVIRSGRRLDRRRVRFSTFISRAATRKAAEVPVFAEMARELRLDPEDICLGELAANFLLMHAIRGDIRAFQILVEQTDDGDVIDAATTGFAASGVDLRRVSKKSLQELVELRARLRAEMEGGGDE